MTMVQDLDEALRRLSAAPLHPGLDSIEGAVLGRLHERVMASPRQSMSICAVAALGALTLGIATSNPVDATQSPGTLSPFGPSSPLAPSTLLAAHR